MPIPESEDIEQFLDTYLNPQWSETPEGRKAKAAARTLLIKLVVGAQEKLLKRLEESINQHTVPEGAGLITRSYVQNTINFELTTLRKENGSDDKTI